MVNGSSPHGIARPAGRIADPGAPLLSFGLPGYKQASGFPYEEWLLELSGDQGRRNYREMMDTSPVVGAARTALEALMAQVSYETVPAQGKKIKGSKAAEEVAEFVDGACNDIEDGWSGHQRESLGYLFWGWQWYESEFKVRQGPQDPLPFQIAAAYGHYPTGWEAERTPPSSIFSDQKIGWRRFGMRGQETLLRWEFTPDAQDLLGMWQIPPPDYRLRFIPAAKSFNYRTRTTKGNPEGFSLLRNGWTAHKFSKGAMVHEGIGMERDLAGLPVAKVPPYLLEENPTADAAFMRSQIEQIVTNIRNDEQGGVIWPLQYDDAGREMFILELMSTGGVRQFDTDRIVSRYEQRILMTFLADFLMIGTSGPGARALVDPRVNLFSLVGEAYLAQKMGTFNQDAIPLLLAVNNIPQELAPRRRAGRVNLTKLVDLASYVLSFSQANSYSPLAPDVQETLLQRADLPTAGTIEMLADQKQQAAQMAAMPPTVPQGRSPIATGGQAAQGRVPTKSPPPRPDASPRTGGQGARATTHRTPGRTATPMTGAEPEFPRSWPDWVAHEVADLWKERPSDLSPEQWGEILIGQGQRMVRAEARRSRPSTFEMGETRP